VKTDTQLERMHELASVTALVSDSNTVGEHEAQRSVVVADRQPEQIRGQTRVKSKSARTDFRSARARAPIDLPCRLYRIVKIDISGL
jgi:hypothetical protein